MVRTTIMAEEETLKKISQIAYKTGKSKAHIIRDALVEYVAANSIDDESEQNWPTNPLMSILKFADSIDGVPTDVSDGKDEEMLRDILGKRYEDKQNLILETEQDSAYAGSD